MDSIEDISDSREASLPELLPLWEASVRATHHFLTESDIAGLKPLVEAGLRGVATLAVIRDGERIAGFAGVEDGKLEMLFLRPGSRGHGYGRKLLQYAVERHGVKYLDVNEQNPEALGFYEHCGFAVYGRSEADGQGNPFPLLHMTRRIVETERLYLREMTPSDLPALCSMLQDIEVMYAWEHAFSDEEVSAWIDRNRARYREYGCGYWLAVDKISGRVVGQAGLIPEEIEGRRHLGIGWMLAREHWHRGYAVEAAKACLEYAFRVRGEERIVADIRPQNGASIRVAESLGMLTLGEYDKVVGGKIMPHRLYYIRTPQITVTDYDPAWLEAFQTLARLLAPVLHRFGGALEHIGSTSVEGLAAKPVIDVDYVLADAALWPQVKRELETLGFYHRGDGGLPGREMFTESLRLDFRHNFYVCVAGSPHLENHLQLRGYLRGNPEALRRYGECKKRLAREFPDSVDDYCVGKSDLLSEFLAAAGFDVDTVDDINKINKSCGLTR